MYNAVKSHNYESRYYDKSRYYNYATVMKASIEKSRYYDKSHDAFCAD